VEVERLNGPVLVVLQRVSGWAITSTFNAVALPAFQLPKHRFARLDSIRRNFRFGGNMNRFARLISFPSWRERLDICDQIFTVFIA
jgi:hypothetical protein